MQIRTAPSLLVLMESLDWLTTIVGITYFGAVEANPFIAGLARTNLYLFTFIKLGTAFFVGYLFYQADKTLNHVAAQGSKTTKRVRLLLKTTYFVALAFLLFAVLNNILTFTTAATV